MDPETMGKHTLGGTLWVTLHTIDQIFTSTLGVLITH